jgi:hypothetical protein
MTETHTNSTVYQERSSASKVDEEEGEYGEDDEKSILNPRTYATPVSALPAFHTR